MPFSINRTTVVDDDRNGTFVSGNVLSVGASVSLVSTFQGTVSGYTSGGLS